MKNNKKYWLLIILLIIIIIVLLFFNKFWKTGNPLIPTGNVDVFDIDIHYFCRDNDCGTKNVDDIDKTGKIDKDKYSITSNNNYYTTGTSSEVPTYNESIDKNVTGIIYVDDKNGNYIYQQKLEIFNNAAFEYTNKIAPGVSNTYNFVVHNSTDTKLKYYLEMYEASEYKVNLKYRLKRNNSYIIGNENNWVTADELKTEFSKINADSSDNYSLDWKWVYDDGKDAADTLAGKNMISEYKLNVRFYFESTE